MKLFFLNILFFIMIQAQLFSQTKKICITVDDLPVVSYGIQDTSYLKEVITGLVDKANKYKTPLIGYVVEGTMYTDGKIDSFKVDLLKYWINNGNDLGNHSYSHTDYNTVTIDAYIADVIKGEQITKSLLSEHNKHILYFRHPYLHTGATKALNDELQHRLDSLGYVVAPVTIDNDDYVFAHAYHNAFMKNDKETMKFIGKEYVAYMEQKLLHFEKVSNVLCKRSINQTLLIHANLLNAHYLDALIKMYKKCGYRCVSQQEILTDKAYTNPINWYTTKGESWLYRWFANEELINLKIGDPEVSEKIRQ